MSERPPGIDGRRVDDGPADRTAYGVCVFDGSTLRLIRVIDRGSIYVDVYCPTCLPSSAGENGAGLAEL